MLIYAQPQMLISTKQMCQDKKKSKTMRSEMEFFTIPYPFELEHTQSARRAFVD